MVYDYNIKRPMQTVKLKLNMMVDDSQHLINALERSVNHPLIKKIPIKIN